MFTIICRCAVYKTHNSMSRSPSQKDYKCFDIWARHVVPGHLVCKWDYKYHMCNIILENPILKLLIIKFKYSKYYKQKGACLDLPLTDINLEWGRTVVASFHLAFKIISRLGFENRRWIIKYLAMFPKHYSAQLWRQNCRWTALYSSFWLT